MWFCLNQKERSISQQDLILQPVSALFRCTMAKVPILTDLLQSLSDNFNLPVKKNVLFRLTDGLI